MARLKDEGPIGRPKTAQYLAMRAKIVLRCAGGVTNKQVAADLGVDQSTVDRRRDRASPDHKSPQPGTTNEGMTGADGSRCAGAGAAR
ncbi:helix-turn-helix domain-containing protein [Streptomyces olivochromogenes]|uniref:helix-turn-helix domain-containing protein n=1 Tax=Streptomyces olivochromogenes TaxID=1963 RepID=UPI0027E524E0|nr:helix-turn-helix domain-containing protein [Streptomyces olivochromogenes]MCF3132072.1 helix-turn-helix domain-containing protein [Streptomyces olivochromogenes]